MPIVNSGEGRMYSVCSNTIYWQLPLNFTAFRYKVFEDGDTSATGLQLANKLFWCVIRWGVQYLLKNPPFLVNTFSFLLGCSTKSKFKVTFCVELL